MSADKPLTGRVAWVTGSSRGLGRIMATRLCRLGAMVALHGTRQDSPKTFNEGASMDQVFQSLIDRTRTTLDLDQGKTIFGFRKRSC